MDIEIRPVAWRFREPFVIASHSRTHASAIEVTVIDGMHRGHAEAAGVAYLGEDPASIRAQIEAVRPEIANGLSRYRLQTLLPPGGARNALDCALWDLEAKKTGRAAWKKAHLPSMQPLLTACTISLAAPAAMAAAAQAFRDYPLLKLKLGGGRADLDRVRAVRAVRADARIIVDANQAWKAADLAEFIDVFETLGVELIEQPLPVGDDDALSELTPKLMICADESCQSLASLPSLAGKYQAVNIKLDKAGGLTHALEMAAAARAGGFAIMIGCMAGSSLAMAPAFIAAQAADFVDLDTPILLLEDRPDPIIYSGAVMSPPAAMLWG